MEECSTILDRALLLLNFSIKDEKITVTKHISSNLPKTSLRVNNIQQVFVNIIKNAIDAVKESNKKEINIDISKIDDFIQITIADSGCGVPKENLEQIYDPFFTTKPVGKGTGLGLGVCKNIVSAHGGHISCESTVNQGTTFKILLPIESNKLSGRQDLPLSFR